MKGEYKIIKTGKKNVIDFLNDIGIKPLLSLIILVIIVAVDKTSLIKSIKLFSLNIYSWVFVIILLFYLVCYRPRDKRINDLAKSSIYKQYVSFFREIFFSISLIMFSSILLGLFFDTKTNREIISIITTLGLLRLMISITMILTELSFISLMLLFVTIYVSLFIIGIFDIKWWALATSLLVLWNYINSREFLIFLNKGDTKIDIPAKLEYRWQVNKIVSYIVTFIIYFSLLFSSVLIEKSNSTFFERGTVRFYTFFGTTVVIILLYVFSRFYFSRNNSLSHNLIGKLFINIGDFICLYKLDKFVDLYNETLNKHQIKEARRLVYKKIKKEKGELTMSEVKVLKNFINGEFEGNTNYDYINVLNPSTEEVIAKIPSSSEADVDRAIDVAEVAQRDWEKLPAIQRGAYLRKIAERIREREPEITQTIVNEGGKTFDLAKVEVLFTADYLDYMAEWARRYEGEIIQSDRQDEHIFLFKRPHGVTTGILPWNFPFFLIARKAAPALLTGNTIVLKPSQLTPINADIFAEICVEVGLPKGILNIIHGRGSVVGNRLASNPKVGLVSLTGSLTAGQEVMRAAAENITNVSLELGGKAPAIVFKDADLNLAAKAIVASRVINSGQVCNCAERVYVHEDVKDEFEKILFAELDKVKFGDPNKEGGLDYGPLIEKRAVDAVAEKVAYAVKQGATLSYGGTRDENQVGYFFGPTVLTDVTNEMKIMKEETFGPVIPVATFKTLEKVLEYANDSEYGLTSSVYTTNLNTAFKAVNGLKFGETYINRENFEAMQGFHAGRRKSGIGGADGKHGLEEYLTTQVVYMQLDNE